VRFAGEALILAALRGVFGELVVGLRKALD
jgi:hypothetical protein